MEYNLTYNPNYQSEKPDEITIEEVQQFIKNADILIFDYSACTIDEISHVFDNHDGIPSLYYKKGRYSTFNDLIYKLIKYTPTPK
jgi:hypothetical protein